MYQWRGTTSRDHQLFRAEITDHQLLPWPRRKLLFAAKRLYNRLEKLRLANAQLDPQPWARLAI
jgi:hypothetical protein